MKRVQDVPVLQSLAGHTVHRCDQCGQILLVQEDRAGPVERRLVVRRADGMPAGDHLRVTALASRQTIYPNALSRPVSRATRFVPSVWSSVMIASAMAAQITPYSIAVAPEQSDSRRLNRGTSLPLCARGRTQPLRKKTFTAPNRITRIYRLMRFQRFQIALNVTITARKARGSVARWCRMRGLNPRPSVYKTAALPLKLVPALSDVSLAL